MPRSFRQDRGLRAPLKSRSGIQAHMSFVACTIISVVVLTVSCRMGNANPLLMLRSAFSFVTTPVIYAGSLITAPVRALGNVVSNLSASPSSISDLRAENEQLKAQLVQLQEAQETANRLQQLVQLKNTYHLQSTAARIISGDSDTWSSSLKIDKGSNDGLAVGMPVTTSSGVIGQIIATTPTTSTVLRITDESSSVAAMVQSSRAQGMLTGSATGQIYLSLVRSTETVHVGDMIITSGLGGVFPKGLPIAQVTNVENTAGSLYLTITVSALSKGENDEEVLVITSLTEDQRASAEDIAAADSQDRQSTQESSENSSSTTAVSEGADDTSDNSTNTSTNTTGNGAAQ